MQNIPFLQQTDFLTEESLAYLCYSRFYRNIKNVNVVVQWFIFVWHLPWFVQHLSFYFCKLWSKLRLFLTCIPFNICEHHGHPILTILEQKERTHCWGPHSKSQHLSIHGHHEHEAVNDASLSHSHHRKSGGEVVGQCWCSHTIYWKKIKSYVRLEIMGSSSITSWFYEDELDPINLRS